jgi:hypothetical protein
MNMFERFESHYTQDVALARPQRVIAVENPNDPLLDGLLLKYSGASFNNGLYRIMGAETQGLADVFVISAFPGLSNKIKNFAYDWLGRIFALDPIRLVGGLPAVLMFEPGTGKTLEIPCNLLTFHDNELVDYREEALAEGFHTQWLVKCGVIPKQDQCIAYKQPLFLGGKDTIENLELSNLDVYWTLIGQLIRKARGFAHGTQIGKIRISE